MYSRGIFLNTGTPALTFAKRANFFIFSRQLSITVAFNSILRKIQTDDPDILLSVWSIVLELEHIINLISKWFTIKHHACSFELISNKIETSFCYIYFIIKIQVDVRLLDFHYTHFDNATVKVEWEASPKKTDF
jgi:hypothetical protein